MAGLEPFDEGHAPPPSGQLERGGTAGDTGTNYCEVVAGASYVGLANGFLTLFQELIFGLPKSLHELLPVTEKLGHPLVQVSSDLIDGQEERHLTLPERVENLTVVLGDSEDALAVGDQFHVSKMFVEPGLLPQEVVCAANSLKRHAAVE